MQLLLKQIPKAQKIQSSHQSFCTFRICAHQRFCVKCWWNRPLIVKDFLLIMNGKSSRSQKTNEFANLNEKSTPFVTRIGRGNILTNISFTSNLSWSRGTNVLAVLAHGQIEREGEVVVEGGGGRVTGLWSICVWTSFARHWRSFAGCMCSWAVKKHYESDDFEYVLYVTYSMSAVACGRFLEVVCLRYSVSRVSTNKARWLFLSLFWSLLNWAAFLRQQGQNEKLAYEHKTKPQLANLAKLILS